LIKAYLAQHKNSLLGMTSLMALVHGFRKNKFAYWPKRTSLHVP